jgi:hypothetical protein
MKKPNLFTRPRWRGDAGITLAKQRMMVRRVAFAYPKHINVLEWNVARAYCRRRNLGKGRVFSQTRHWLSQIHWREYEAANS